MGIFIRLIPFALILLATWYAHVELVKIESKKEEFQKNWFGKVIWFLFGWTFSLHQFGTALRAIVSFWFFWWLINFIVSRMLAGG